MLLPSTGFKKTLLAASFMLISCLAFSSVLKMDIHPKRLMTFSGQHGVISQKVELFTRIAVRTSKLK
jgi:hypothetical protein